MMNRRDFVLTTAAGLAAAALPQAIRAANSTPARVDPVMLQKLVDEIARELGIVGGQMALFDGTQVHEFTTGLADRERGLAVTPDTLFQIGSTTKVFNAATIMSLVDEGVLDLDAPVKTWIKDFKVPDPDSTAGITLRQLLSMSAGLDNGPYTSYGRGDDALGQYVAAMADIPVIFPAGTAFGYSNASTNISGYAAQMATGKNWETLLQERILDPLGLKQSANFPEDLLYHPIAIGYRYGEGAETPERVPYWGLPRSMAPAGASLCCSAGDLVRFATMFLRGGMAESGAQVISGNAVKTMHTSQVELPATLTAQQWCTGPYRKTWGGHVIYGHSGTNTGGSSMLLWCPDRNIAIATISNVPRQGYPFADKVFSTVFPQVFDIQKPVLPKPGNVTPASVDLERFVGAFDAWGSHIEFVVQDEKLIMNMFEGDERAKPGLSTEIIPLGGDRFLPADPAAGGNRGWDVAFWGDDGNGRATHFLNGVFAMRRTG
jgi:CubicO group peptidase (beta-lactamase class C family)